MRFLSRTLREFNTLLIEACEEMGVYSGEQVYPIKDISGLMRPNTIFHITKNQFFPHLDVNGMWDEETSYGRSREAVLIRLIEKCEDLLEA